MEKTNQYVHKNILNRRSPVVFSDKEIEEEMLLSLFEAARWAPSGRNSQPWRFIFAKKTDKEYAKFIKCLFPDNEIWAKYAPILAFCVSKKTDSNGAPSFYSQFNAGLTVGNLLNQATSLNIYVHLMGGYDRDLARKEFKVPNEYDLLTMMAIGYLGNLEDFPEEIQKMEIERRNRIRMDLNEILFKGEFGKSF